MNDLAALFDAAPAQPSQEMRFRQGVIVTFDPITLENTVSVGGSTLTNLPLLGVGEATLLVPGSVVGIRVVGGPAKTMFIDGRIVTPNTADAADAVSLLSSRTQAAYDTTDVSTTNTAYTDLGGPAVSGVVGPSGRVLVFTGALISGFGENIGGAIRDTGAMAVELSGGNTLAASDEWAYSKAFVITPTTVGATIIGRDVAAHVFSDLTPGLTTFTAMYHSASGGSTANFTDRTVVAMFL